MKSGYSSKQCVQCGSEDIEFKQYGLCKCWACGAYFDIDDSPKVVKIPRPRHDEFSE